MECKYDISHTCDGCDVIKNTREVEGLDPKRKYVKNYLCKKCDNSYKTIPKILSWNRKHLKESTTIFGTKIEDVHKYNYKIYIR